MVLNACQSGQLEAVAEAAIATRLVQDRVASVIAMAYSVYTHAAAEFITAFYERLFAGDRVSDAVTAGRQRLAIADTRPSPKGPLPLKDWVVPVHYRRSDITLPGLHIDRTGQPPFQEILDRHRTPSSSTPGQGDGALTPNGVFVGRDRLFHALETSLPNQKVVVLHGPAGIGKSELAKAFGRWWRDTQGVDAPTLVFWYSFKPGAHASFSLDGVISQIGMQAFGAEFATLSPEQQKNAVQELLTACQSLLVWDNFETTHTLPDPTSATPPLNETERDKITAFLRCITHSRSALVITSRTPEDWLSQVRRIEVGRLTHQEANEYTDHLLASYPNTLPKRQGEAFAELLQWLDGHPMSMKLILPLLDETDPDTLLDGLRGTTPLPGRDDADRDTSLAASITYSFTHLDPCDQQAFTALSLFHNTADTNVLGMLSEISEVPAQFRGRSRDDWDRILNRATKIGLLTGMGDGINRMYWIHPALPSYLAELWGITHPDDFPAQHAATIRALLDVFASLSIWLDQQIQRGDTPLSTMIIERHKDNLGSFLGYALKHNQWKQAQAIIQTLNKYWKLRGLNEEAHAWSERTRNILERTDGTPPALDSNAGDLWLFVISAEAVLQIDALKLEEAEQTYRNILEELEQLNHRSPQQELNVSIIYHQLGLIFYRQGEYEKAKRLYEESLSIGEQFNYKSGKASNYHHLGIISYTQGDYESAEKYYRESLAIHVEEGDQIEISSLCHELGMVCRKQGELKEAEKWYVKSLNISQEINDRPRQASSYHQLSILFCEQGELTSAEKWCHKAISLYEKLANRPEKAYAYHQLGIIYSLKGEYKAAEDWYNKSLETKRKIGDHPGLASSYHQLGIAAQRQGHYNAAEEFYKKSLSISQQIDSQPGKAACYGQLGILSEERGDPGQGLSWIVKSVCLFDTFPHPATGSTSFHLKRLSRQLGLPILERVWQEVTGQDLPAVVRQFVQNSDDTI